MGYQFEEKKPTDWLGAAVVIFIVGVTALMYFLLPVLAYFGPMTPTFSVESAAVKAYNLTSDNKLITLIKLRVRAGNPNPNNSSTNLLLQGIVAEVTKGKGHVLAQQTLPGALLLSTESETLVHVEAAGLGHKLLEREIAEEVRADAAAGEGRVNVHLYAEVWWVASSDGLSCVCVTCEDVVVDFSRSTERVQRVDCESRVYSWLDCKSRMDCCH